MRAYERRGPTWSDRVLLDRDSLVKRLQQGKRFYVGTRKAQLASEFELKMPIRLQKDKANSFVVVGDAKRVDADQLEALPLV